MREDSSDLFVGDTRIELPGLATTHSHAFQRALRGRTQRPASGARSFWSWRGLMYDLADRLDPSSIYDLSYYAFVELASSGVTAVGEFHYVHHQPGGAPYADRTAMADAVTRAAVDAGLRITLLRAIYQRAGAGQPPEGAQRRFSDADVDAALADVDVLRARYDGHPLVKVGIAPHSVRAVTAETFASAAAHARRHGLPLHAHLAEQRREIDECVAEHGVRPVELAERLGAIDERFVAVHATHLVPAEAVALGARRAFVCVSRTTERDLGDGLPDLAALVKAGARLTVGTDSHATSDPFEEARAMELDERSRTESRHAALDGRALLRALAADGYASIGWTGAERTDRVILDRRDPGIDLLDGDDPVEATLWTATSRAVREVSVAGRTIVKDGRHIDYDAARARYESTLRRLMSR